MIIQILNEFGDKASLIQLKREVESYCSHHHVSNTARMLTCSAYYNIHVEKNMDKAKKELDTALKIVFEAYDRIKKEGIQSEQIIARFEIINCLYCYGIYYCHVQNFQASIKEFAKCENSFGGFYPNQNGY